MAKKRKKALGRANEARRKAHASELNDMLIERSRSNANGTHQNKGTRRLRTREAQRRNSLRDFGSGSFLLPSF